MSNDYYSRVQYTPPPTGPRRANNPRALLIGVGIAIVLAALIGVCLWQLSKQSLADRFKLDLPAARAVIGVELAWRKLDIGGASLLNPAGTVGGLFNADFDADGDEELLIIRPVGRSLVFEADGSSREAGIGGVQFMMGGETWDYNRDGIAEIVVSTMLGDVMQGVRSGQHSAEDIYISQTLAVYDLDGAVLKSLAAVAHSDDQMMVCDIDGDGHDELLACEPDPDQKYGSNILLAFGMDGQRVWRLKQGMMHFSTHGDVDGDGLEELVVSANRMQQLVALGMDQDEAALFNTTDTVTPLACYDLNGDGQDEVLYSTREMTQEGNWSLHCLDPATGAETTFVFPDMPRQPSGMGDNCVIGDFLPPAGPEIACVNSLMGSAVVIFDRSGTCIYYEELGDLLMGIGQFQAGGQDYLVLRLSDKMVVYP